MSQRIRKASILACAAWAISCASMSDALADGPTTRVTDPGQAVTLANARQYELASKINGQTYRLMVYVPPATDLAKPQPVVYVLDGSYYFGTACDAMATNKLAGIVVAVGYPTDDRDELKRRRTFDLSLPNAKADPKYGGGDAFLRVVDEEVKPFIKARYPVDPARQALFGHSLGGLMVLREMFRHPDAYATYLACSPSIWWNGRAVLADEQPFSDHVRAGKVRLTLLVLSAADEQYHGDDPAALAKAQKGVRMVDNATELAVRLSKLAPDRVKVTREVISGETHVSGSLASLNRGLCFALTSAER